MERRTGSLVSQGSAEKNAGEDIAALLDRLKIVYRIWLFSFFFLDINLPGLSRQGSQVSDRDSPPSHP